MLPFSVLRMWGLGIFGWVLLGLGIYCLWEWADGIDPPVARRVVREPTDRQPPIPGETVPRRAEASRGDEPATTESRADVESRAEVQRADGHRDRQGGWPYLVGGLALLALSSGGGLPLILLAGRPRLTDDPPPKQPLVKVIERPDGSRLHVELYGDNVGPTLVFTHGWSLDSTAWAYAIRQLSGRYRVVVWDLPGMGQSRGPTTGDFSLEKMAADLEAVVQVAGKGPIILVGHSIGGMILQTYCRLYPKQLGPRVGALVLLHTTFTNPLRTALGAPLWTAIEKPLLVPLNHLTVWLAPLAWLSNWQSYLNGSLHVATRIASFSGRQTWGQLSYGAWLAAKAWPAAVARGNLAMLRFDEQAELPNVEIPVLIIAAGHDRMTKPGASERLEVLLPNARRIEIQSGHLGLWEQSREVAELISEFASQQESPKSSEACTSKGESSPTARGAT